MWNGEFTALDRNEMSENLTTTCLQGRLDVVRFFFIFISHFILMRSALEGCWHVSALNGSKNSLSHRHGRAWAWSLWMAVTGDSSSMLINLPRMFRTRQQLSSFWVGTRSQQDRLLRIIMFPSGRSSWQQTYNPGSSSIYNTANKPEREGSDAINWRHITKIN